MHNLKNLSVGTQVMVTVGTLCALLLIIGALSFFSLRSIERGNDQQARTMRTLAVIDDTVQDVELMQASALRQLLASESGQIARLDKNVRDLETGVIAKLA